MQIVIDIDEKVYGLLKYFEKSLGLNDKKDSNDDVKTALMRAVINGIPLPKGHGRLIDADDLEGHRQIQIVPCGNGKYTEVTTYYQNDIDTAPTIIEADTESEDEE